MEDRYLFKAKRIDNGEWVKGALVYDDMDKLYRIITEIDYSSGTCMTTDKAPRVDASTICQCTGLKDKNGKLIWENDVVRFKHEKFDFYDGLEPLERSCLPNKKEYTRNYAVEFCNTSTNYGLRFRNKSVWFMVHRMTVVMHDVEVIGNIFDNPELMHE